MDISEANDVIELKIQRVTMRTYINMMTSSYGNIFRVTGHLCGEFTGSRWIPRTKPSDAELDVFFDVDPN